MLLIICDIKYEVLNFLVVSLQKLFKNERLTKIAQSRTVNIKSNFNLMKHEGNCKFNHYPH